MDNSVATAFSSTDSHERPSSTSAQLQNRSILERQITLIPSLQFPAKKSVEATPIPTITPAPTDTYTANANSSEPSSDLLYITEDRLVRWDPRTRFGAVLAENVLTFSASYSGSVVAMKRAGKVAHDGVRYFDLDILDFNTKQIRKIVSEMASVEEITLSPDGKWLAVLRLDVKWKIQVISVIDPATTIDIGGCYPADSIPCSKLEWSPSSKHLLWTDTNGIWVASPEEGNASLIHPGLVTFTDPQGKTGEMKASFSDPQWSPMDRFLLLKVSLVQSPVHWQAVFDTKKAQLFLIDDTYRTGPSDVSISWLADGSIAIAASSDPGEERTTAIQIWGLVPTNPELLVLNHKFDLASQNLLETLVLRDIPAYQSNIFRLEWLQPIDRASIILRARLLNCDHQPILLQLDLKKGVFNPVAEIMLDAQKIFLSPDGCGFMVLSSAGMLKYHSFRNGESIEIQPNGKVLVENVRWLPPSLRNLH